MSDTEHLSQPLAAIDLGSNSFHLILAREVEGQIQTIEKRGEKVQLAAGLDAQRRIAPAAEERALACLERFAQRLQGMPRSRVTVLGTNTLRAASNARDFIRKANTILGFPIEVIAGIEEARLIYLGVAHTLADDEGKRLVVDIGGGSTEFIIGERFRPIELESLEMGCVAYHDKFFSDGLLNKTNFKLATKAAQQEIQRIRSRYKKVGWQNVVGSSGTIRAATRVLKGYGLSGDGIQLKALRQLRDLMIDQKQIDQLSLQGVKDQRLRVFPAGVAILIGIFEALGIEHMGYSDGALREGALYDLLGRAQHEDVREKTVDALQARYAVDIKHSERVKKTVTKLYEQVKGPWKLDNSEYADWLRWAGDLFEMGLSVAHSQFHKHGAYLIQHSDMPGFSQQTQHHVSLLVAAHRRKIPMTELDSFTGDDKLTLLRLIVLLRIAVLLHHGRGQKVLVPNVSVGRQSISLAFPDEYLATHSMMEMDLALERDFEQAAGIELSFC